MNDARDAADRQPLYLDDLVVGRVFVSETYSLDAAQICEFAAKFDPQPFHLDAEAARHTFFGQLVASGWHTAAISMRLFVEGGPPLAGGLIGAGGEIAWPNATRANSILHLESEILEIKPSRSHPERGMVTVRNTTLDEHGTVVQTLVCRMVVPRQAVPRRHG